MTLDGTRTYIIGRAHCAVIDPGPAIESHINAIADAVGSGVSVQVLLTHDHPDHAEGVAPLLQRLPGARAPSAAPAFTDAGDLFPIRTPGHTPDHLSFWWPKQHAVFCGDLMMGGSNTALVAPPEGHLGQYLESLEKLRTLRPQTIYPAHGEPFDDPVGALETYIRHRQERIAQVLVGLRDGPKTADQLMAYVYGGSVPAELRPYARAAIHAYIDHLNELGEIRPHDDGWVRT